MEISKFFSLEKLNEQVWFQQIKSKWDELDDQSRFNAKTGAAVASSLVFVFITISAMLSVSQAKRDLSDRADLVNLIQGASDEIRRLREQNSKVGDAKDLAAWKPYFEGFCGNSGVPAASLSLIDEKEGKSSDQVKETLFNLVIKKINLKQMTKFIAAIELGARPVKIRNLFVDTKQDPAGYIDAVIALSAFSLKPESKTDAKSDKDSK